MENDIEKIIEKHLKHMIHDLKKDVTDHISKELSNANSRSNTPKIKGLEMPELTRDN